MRMQPKSSVSNFAWLVWAIVAMGVAVWLAVHFLLIAISWAVLGSVVLVFVLAAFRINQRDDE